MEIAPGSALIFELMGSLWAWRTDKGERTSFETAKEWFQRAIAIEKSARLFSQLGGVYVALDDNVPAAEAFEEALRLDDCYEEAMYNLAKLRESTQPDEAIRLLERALERDPSYGLAHQALGILVEKRGDLVKAEYHFRRCLEIDARDYLSMLFLANVLGAQGKETQAEREYENAIAFDPKEKAGPLLYAKFLDFIGKPDKAAEVRSSITKRRWH